VDWCEYARRVKRRACGSDAAQIGIMNPSSHPPSPNPDSPTNCGDDKYLLRVPIPEPVQAAQHPKDQRRVDTANVISVIALVVAGSSALFALLQWRAADKQADIAMAALRQTQKAATEQSADIERTRRAAEKSADQAADLAAGMKESAVVQSKSLSLAEQQFATLRGAVHGGMQPLLYDVSAKISGDEIEFTIANKGKLAARVGQTWCGAGFYLPAHIEGQPMDLQLVMDSTPEIFRRRTIAPDTQERLALPVLRRGNPALFASYPVLALIKEDTSWTVVCDIPYSDELDQTEAAHHLQFCYYTAPAVNGQREAVLCPADKAPELYRKLRSASRRGSN
jgi:hypothetical protein